MLETLPERKEEKEIKKKKNSWNQWKINLDNPTIQIHLVVEIQTN